MVRPYQKMSKSVSSPLFRSPYERDRLVKAPHSHGSRDHQRSTSRWLPVAQASWRTPAVCAFRRPARDGFIPPSGADVSTEDAAVNRRGAGTLGPERFGAPWASLACARFDQWAPRYTFSMIEPEAPVEPPARGSVLGHVNVVMLTY